MEAAELANAIGLDVTAAIARTENCGFMAAECLGRRWNYQHSVSRLQRTLLGDPAAGMVGLDVEALHAKALMKSSRQRREQKM